MVKINKLIFGYRKIKAVKGGMRNSAALLLKHGISAEFVSENEFVIAERDIKRFLLLIGDDGEYVISEPLGLCGKIRLIPHKAAVSFALILSLALMCFTSNLVWDIRIEEGADIPDGIILYNLEECGFAVGSFWNAIDKSKVENELLARLDEVAWVNINRRGTVAYVTLSKKESGGDVSATDTPRYANIIAAEDCIIEEITVTRGVAMVKVGDAVKKGDILISGVASGAAGGELCLAEGNVIGRVNNCIEVKIEKNYTEKIASSPKLKTLAIKIFGFSLNILNFYGNSESECDIIEDRENISLFGKYKLPIELIRVYKRELTNETKEFSDAELVRLASRRLSAATCSRIAAADLVSISTEGEFIDGGYRMSSRFVFITDVGEVSPFSVE